MSRLLDESTSLRAFKICFIGVGIMYVAWRAYVVRKGLKGLGGIPKLLTAFEPFTIFGAIVPETSWNFGLNFQWSKRHSLYHKGEVVVVVPCLWGSPMVWTGNLDIARQVVSSGPESAWIKPQKYSQPLLIWGMNLGSADRSDIWRRHRRIMGPAFNNKTYTLVWNETMRVYREMVHEEGWLQTTSTEIPVIQKYTFKLTMLIISACGFGLPYSWNEPPKVGDGELSLQEALKLIVKFGALRTTLPKWFWKLPLTKCRRVDLAYHTVDAFMKEQVNLRKAHIRRQLIENGGEEINKNDVFSHLVLANLSASEKYPLDDQELLGNIFLLLFTGSDTTAQTLAATLGFLGIYQEEQDAVYEQILNVIGDGRDPVVEDYSSLYKVLAAFLEALRLIPSALVMIREAIRDTDVLFPNKTGIGGVEEVPISKGTTVSVDMVGLGYNMRYFSDPDAYRPSRWYEQETGEVPDAHTAFSFGQRACIGRKFSTTQAVCWLALLLRDFKVKVIAHPGETKEQLRDRLMQTKMTLTLGVKDLSVRLVRRSAVEKL